MVGELDGLDGLDGLPDAGNMVPSLSVTQRVIPRLLGGRPTWVSAHSGASRYGARVEGPASIRELRPLGRLLGGRQCLVMPSAHTSGSPNAPRDPWFRRQPRLTVSVIAALFGAVLGLRLLEWTSPDAYSMFYVLPVALAAAAFGERGGVAASLVAVVLMVVTAWAGSESPDAVGWATQVVPIALLGVLLGRATDRARVVEAERRRLEVAGLLHRQAIEINDSIVQRMAAAKWSLEAGQTDAGLEKLTVAVAEAQRLVSELIRRAQMGERAEQVDGTSEAPTAPNP